MKRILCFVMITAMLAALSGCGGSSQEKGKGSITPGMTGKTPTEVGEHAPGFSEDGTMMVADGALLAENQSPYMGEFWEDGSGSQVSSVYAVSFTNLTDQLMEDAEIVYSNGERELIFHISMLPAGEQVLVAEVNRTQVAETGINYVESHIEYLEYGEEATDCIDISVDTSGNITVQNLTDDFLPVLRVFYAPQSAEGIRLGGHCDSVVIDGIEGGGTAQGQAENWSENSRVIDVTMVWE